MMRCSSSYGGVLVGLSLSCAVLLFAAPGPLSAAPQVGEVSPEKWVDGPEAVQVGTSRSYPDVGVANSGMRVHAWSECGIGRSSASEIILRRFDADGNPLDDPKQINTTTDNIQRYARVAVSADGSFLVIWQSWEVGPAERIVIRSRAYGSNGNPLGPEHGNTLTRMSSLASMRIDSGDLAGAEELAGRTGEIGGRALGENHPAVGRYLQPYATALERQGRLEEAKPFVEHSTGPLMEAESSSQDPSNCLVAAAEVGH